MIAIIIGWLLGLSFIWALCRAAARGDRGIR